MGGTGANAAAGALIEIIIILIHSVYLFIFGEFNYHKLHNLSTFFEIPYLLVDCKKTMERNWNESSFNG